MNTSPSQTAPFLFSCAVLVFLLAGCTSRQLAPGEGFVNVNGGKIWYRINGSGTKTPVLLLHGGPGSSSYYLEPLKALSNERPVIFIDQLGCGRSTRITDTTLMTIEQNVEQLEQVRQALHLENFVLFGHSWGTMLGIDYYIHHPQQIKGIIFASPLFSTDLWIKDADTLISTLPDSIETIIRQSEKNKTFDNGGYKEAIQVYGRNFGARLKPQRSTEQRDSARMMSASNVYEFMWGPSEFTATGNLMNYDRLKNLPEIAVPTLLMTGDFDEARPSTVKYYQSRIPGATFTLIHNSGHVIMNDNPDETLAAIREFLSKMDQLK